jgi:hypothetical protein
MVLYIKQLEQQVPATEHVLVAISSVLTADDLADTFSRLIPAGLKIDVFPESDTRD